MKKDIPGYEGFYQIDSTTQQIWSVRRQIYLSIHLNRKGYPTSSISVSGKWKGFIVHRLIAICFIPNPENKPQVNHKNGIKIDNRIENLEWCTCSDNLKHAFASGLSNRKGTKHHMCTLTESQVIEIRKEFENGSPKHKDLAIKYKTSRSNIGMIKNRHNWTHI